MKKINVLIFLTFSALISFSVRSSISEELSQGLVIDPWVQPFYQKAQNQKNRGELLESRKAYLDIIAQHPNASNIQKLQEELWGLNVAIIFSPLETHQTEMYTIEPGDTLGKIAHKFGTTIELIKRRNHLETNRIIAGQKLSVWLGAFTITIDKSDNTLTLKNGEETVKVYPVSTGKNNSSPAGQFTIKDRYADPVWFHKGDVVSANDPKNFLGTRWLGFDLPKYGIHGTIEPEQIGKQVSSGCIRMRNEDVQEIYDLVPIGTRVAIVE